MDASNKLFALNSATFGAPKVASDRHAQLEKQASNLVAQTFFGTLLKQMRDSPFKDEMFSGGRGGEAFGSMYDQHLAEHMARGAGKKLVNAIVKRFEAKRPGDQYQAAIVAPAAGADASTSNASNRSFSGYNQPGKRNRK
ncbi:hypothetical protein BH09PLA1_BH09PLA1_32890 [soil metagenome]